MTADRQGHRLSLRLIDAQDGEGRIVLMREAPVARDAAVTELTPRLRQVLGRLLAGDSRKQIADRLSLSRHTINDYVKEIYRRLDVSSHAELLAKWMSTRS